MKLRTAAVVVTAVTAVAVTATWLWPSSAPKAPVAMPVSASPSAVPPTSTPVPPSTSTPAPMSTPPSAQAPSKMVAWPDNIPEQYKSDALWEILPDYLPEGAELVVLSCEQFPCIATIVGSDDAELITEMRHTLDMDEDLESLSSFASIEGDEAGELVYQVTFAPDVLVTDELLARAEYRGTESYYRWDVQRGNEGSWEERPVSAETLAAYEAVHGKLPVRPDGELLGAPDEP